MQSLMRLGKASMEKSFHKKLKQLKHDVAPGLGCLRNENMLSLRLNPDRHMTPNIAAAMINFLDYDSTIVTI